MQRPFIRKSLQIKAILAEFRPQANRVRPALVVVGLLDAIVVASYFINSFSQVPLTHLSGILIFTPSFSCSGLPTRAPGAIFATLLMQGLAYVTILARLTLSAAPINSPRRRF